MITTYLKQAWQLCKQNRLYSAVYIIGTGLSIAMIMVVAIIYYVKIAPFYPETERNRTLSFRTMNVRYANDNMSASSLSYTFVRDYIYPLESVENVTAILEVYDEVNYAEQQDTRKLIPITVKYIDPNFWKVFNYEYINGKPFSDEEFNSGIKTVVISAGLARQMFDTTDAEGCRIIVDGGEYRVAGVVRDVSYATPLTYAQLWMPYTLKPEQLNSSYAEGYLGSLRTYLLAPSVSAIGEVKEEVNAIINKINNSQEEYKLDTAGQPEEMWKIYFHQSNNYEIDWWTVFSTFGVMLLALIFVPAINLAGMVSSRMDKRMAEMGVRKAFGGSNGTLIRQLLSENMLLTLFGGLLGLVISCIIVVAGRYWIFTLFDTWASEPPAGVDNLLTAGMLFNPGVFIIALLICLILNLISAIIPAWYGLRKNIIESLNEKD